MTVSPATFTIGANLPWLRYGGDFGANAWHPRGGLSRRTDLSEVRLQLTRLAARGVSVVRWFMLCDGRAGVRFAPDGTPLGPDEALFTDIDMAETLAAEAGVALMPVLLDFAWCSRARQVSGVQLGGRRRVLADPARRAALLERVLVPLFDRYGRSAAIRAWDLINEPEWVTRGAATWNPLRGVSWRAMRSFVREAAASVHSRTSQQVTVGSASTRWLALVRGTGLDFYQPHWYDRLERHSPLDRPVERLRLDRPAWLGEFPTRGSAHSPRRLLEAARRAGYEGALFWSVLADDNATLANATDADELDFADREDTAGDRRDA